MRARGRRAGAPGPLVVLVAAGGLLGAACATPPSPRDVRAASREVSDELIAQLEARLDTRRVRLSIGEFETRGERLRTRRHDGRVYYYDTAADGDLSRRLRNELVEDLAQRVRVVEGEGETEADIVLAGTVSFADHARIVVHTRVIDPATGEILAASTTTLR